MKALGPIPPEIYRALIVRLIMLIVFAGSVGLAWWSVKELPPAERKLEQQNKRIATLESDIQFLEMKPSPLEAEQVAAKYNQAQQLLFSGLEEAKGWEQLKRQPNLLLLTAEPEVRFLGKTQALSILSANLELQATNSPYSRYTNSAYKALLDFAQQLTSQSKRVDLMELTVNGNSNSVSVAKIGLHLWTQETGP
jgi:hypothetical protein